MRWLEKGLPVEGVAQPGVSVVLTVTDAATGDTREYSVEAEEDTGRFSFRVPAAGTPLAPGRYSLVLHTRFRLAESRPVAPIELDVRDDLAWDPQRSYWEGTLKVGPAKGRVVRVNGFRDDSGRYASTGWKVPGAFGFWDTELHLWVCGCPPPDDEHEPDTQVIADGAVYLPEPSADNFLLFNLGSAHEVQYRFLCGDNIYTSDGTMLIDPDGFVYNNTVGFDHKVESATATCYWRNAAEKWVEWPAHLFAGQENPQTTGPEGYFAFFTPPGFYYVKVRDPMTFQSWLSPVVQVKNEIVHGGIL